MTDDSPPPERVKDTVIHLRLPSRKAALVRLIAESETAGNVSELIRNLVEAKIEDRLARSQKKRASDGERVSHLAGFTQTVDGD